jgi:hypothetical protein
MRVTGIALCVTSLGSTADGFINVQITKLPNGQISDVAETSRGLALLPLAIAGRG